MTKKRFDYIDVARAIGMFFIVWGHVLQSGEIRQYIYSFHVPFFFFISGLTYSGSKKRRVFLKGKAQTLLIPYVVFSVISIIIYQLLSGYLTHTDAGNENVVYQSFQNLWGMIYGNSRNGLMDWNRPLWFLPCMFAAMLLVDTFEKFIADAKGIYAVRILFFVAGLALTRGLSLCWPNCMLPFQLESAFAMAAFTELGIILSPSVKSVPEKIKSVKLYVLVAVFAVAACALGIWISGINGFAEVRIHQFGKSMLLYCMTSLLCGGGIFGISILLQNRKALKYLGMRTLPVLLMHKFPIVFFQMVCPFTRGLKWDGRTIVDLVTGLAVSFVVIAMCLVCEKICPKKLKWMLGEKTE